MADIREQIVPSETLPSDSVIVKEDDVIIGGLAVVASNCAEKPRTTTSHKRARKHSEPTQKAQKDSVAQYLHEIGATPLLTPDEEKQLARTIDIGRDATELLGYWDMTYEQASIELQTQIDDAVKAKDHFMRANLRLVVSIAKRYPLKQGVDLLDIIQEGNLGLSHAIGKFDVNKGFKFSTYATHWIRQYIQRLMESKATLIHIPSNTGQAYRSRLRSLDGDSSRLNPEDRRIHLLSTSVSLNTTIGEDNESEIQDIIPDRSSPPEDVALGHIRDDEATKLLDSLDKRHALAVRMRYGLDDGVSKTYRDIGEVLGVTPEAARMTINRALRTMRFEVTKSNYRGFS